MYQICFRGAIVLAAQVEELFSVLFVFGGSESGYTYTCRSESFVFLDCYAIGPDASMFHVQKPTLCEVHGRMRKRPVVYPFVPR